MARDTASIVGNITENIMETNKMTINYQVNRNGVRYE